MAVDLKIELFSVDLFRNLWFKSRLLEFVPPRMKKYGGQKSENSSEAVHAVWCRQQIFHQSLFRKVWDDYDSFSGSGVDFYLLFMTCAFVLEMSCCLAFNANKAYICLAPLSWAMFFDSELKAEFYFEGGWDIFKKYASSYSANILTYAWMDSTCVHSDDYENMKLLFKSANQFYNFPKIFKPFTARYEKRKSKLVMACLKCLPMFLVLRDIVYPGAQTSERSILIEGYLQVVLRMLSEEEIALRRNAFLESLRNGGSDSDGSSDSEDHSSSEEIQSARHAEIIDEAFKCMSTSELVSRLFVDEVECSCGSEPCIFCGRTISSSTECPSTAKFSVHVERIKSAIGKLVDGEARNGAVGGQTTVRNNSDVNEIMRLFLFLGLEPMQSHMLSVLKRNVQMKLKQEMNKDIDDASENLSSFQLHDSTNKGARNKAKRKKSNKK